MITKSTFPTNEWSRKYENVCIDLSKTNTSPIAIVCGVSREKGVELMMTFPKSINIPKFKVFLEELRRKNPFDDIIIQMD